MASVKNGQIKAANSWARHLRRFGKKLFWKQERGAEKRIVARQDS